ncbi:rhodanese-like domain-containing protein [Candidatus Saccharibacteria bacterium]|nr:rhodanese-like domain-containing protein [Candidatus Saccharibacteria bacterium]MCB9835062.1 rhodanese-like domain-containing protein [Candidatus Nomurabacteria bacterium]
MKKWIIGLCIILGLIGIILAGGDNSEQAAQSPSSQITTIEQNLDNGAVLVDVRTAEEYQSGHAAKAINIPLQQIQSGQYGNISPEQQIYVYCRSGNRSAQAIEILKQAGYHNLTDLVSLDNWQSLGGEVTR